MKPSSSVNYLSETTSGGGTESDGFLGTTGYWSELGDGFLDDFTDLLGPLGALGGGGVAAVLILTLLFIDSLALNNIVLNLNSKK